MAVIIFSKSLVEKLRERLSTALKLKNIQAYRLAIAMICYGEGRGITEIAKLLDVKFKTIDQEPDFSVASINYNLEELLSKAERL